MYSTVYLYMVLKLWQSEHDVGGRDLRAPSTKVVTSNTLSSLAASMIMDLIRSWQSGMMRPRAAAESRRLFRWMCPGDAHCSRDKTGLNQHRRFASQSWCHTLVLPCCPANNNWRWIMSYLSGSAAATYIGCNLTCGHVHVLHT